MLQEGMIDFDTAHDCGFGIIRILKGFHKGKFFLYNSENDDEYLGLMLNLYLKISVKSYENKSLEKIIHTKDGSSLIRALQHSNDIDLCQKLYMSFDNNKDKTRIFS